MYDFTSKKFKGFPLSKQHKKCAELLRQLYMRLAAQEACKTEWEIYQQLQEWMDGTPLSLPPSAQHVADRYHEHLSLASISVREHRLLPKIRSGDRSEGAAPWPIAIYLDKLRSAHNVGSIVRTAEAFSLGSLYFSPETPFIDHKQVQNTAMGCHEWIPSFQNVPLESLPRPWIALETSSDALSMDEFIFPASFTLIVGNEEYGCSDETLAKADYILEIPLRGRKNSLNAANAFAIAAWEIFTQISLKDDYEKHKKLNGKKN